jgi:hypothetical protein
VGRHRLQWILSKRCAHLHATTRWQPEATRYKPHRAILAVVYSRIGFATVLEPVIPTPPAGHSGTKVRQLRMSSLIDMLILAQGLMSLLEGLGGRPELVVAILPKVATEIKR